MVVIKWNVCQISQEVYGCDKWDVCQISQEVYGCDQVKCLSDITGSVWLCSSGIYVRYHRKCVVVIKWNICQISQEVRGCDQVECMSQCQISQEVCGCDQVECMSDITRSVWL